MAGLFTPTSRSTGNIPNLKLTPTNTPGFASSRTTKSPGRGRFSACSSSVFPDATLSLKRVIGCSTNAFDSHPPSRSFAYTAGAAAVVVTLDDDLNVTQRFFRARPNAPTLSTAAVGAQYTPSTPNNESRVRAAASLREAGIGYTPSTSIASDDSAGGKTWTARERIKAATCLSFSPDGKWLAVGETGYNPRVLIFSMSKDVPSDMPVAAMSEHTFGVRDVSFSPDSKFLASIGTANDGFIYVWSLNPGNKNGIVQLHASNKCTSFVRQIAWMGRSLITVGTRHVKVWRTEDDVGDGRKPKRKWTLTRKKQKANIGGPVVLHGRNALLGNMSDSTMSCVIGISEDKAIVCSERGDICLLEETQMRFSKVADAGFGVHCIAVDAERKFAWVAGKDGSHSALVLANIVPPTPPASPSSSRSSSPVLPSGCRRADVVAMASMFGHLFTLDSDRCLKIINMTTVEGVPVPNSMVRELPAHKDACLGVRPLPPNHPSESAFFTWSAGGSVIFWSVDGTCMAEFQIELEQPSEGEDDVLFNELKVVRVSKDGDFFVSGDKYGVLRVIDGETREHYYDVKAHSSEIMDITIHNDTIVSCARDRTVQIFTKVDGEWNLSQTLDDHTASVQRVLLLEDGNKLLSCSTDRTIVIRELCRREAIDGTITDAYIPYRTLNTKASPVHMAPIGDSASALLVSTLDRQIIKFDLNSGKSISSFKVSDETGESVVMDAISLSEDRGKPRIIVGTSTIDKSIRVYDLNGGLVDKEWGHTEGVSDVCLLEITGQDSAPDTVSVVSTGTDGTIMIWDFLEKGPSQVREISRDILDPLPTGRESLTAARTPIRRVLSKSELIEFTPRSSQGGEGIGSGSRSVGSTSPPRQLRKKASMYGMRPGTSSSAVSKSALAIQQQTQTVPASPTTATMATSSASTSSSTEDTAISTPLSTPTGSGRASSKSLRGRTPSPPDSTARLPPPPRRPSYDSRTRNASRTRGKSDATTSGSNINSLAESLTRSLRSFRKRAEALSRSENNSNMVRPEVMRDLQRELGLTVKELGRDQAKITEDDGQGDDSMMAMLEAYSAKLLSMVNNRLEEQFKGNGEEGMGGKGLQQPLQLGECCSGRAGGELDRRKGESTEVGGEG
ncbi:WD40-repeat-containing domain protein [Pyronema domesticum]|uniref:Similar to Mitogen-activated protein kinase-binding protein 1 acc. no. Q6NS57 n=1 Tax=Pyronema omphalodes (strain CBS 100304) TaxID=1076935 RepID=U4L2W0_PYROM|nr:WD40-repeat-containing domain protein [Pyronema domesticum]CCX06588.1 Similar to Mitogen-activated protein kinase-binding protein 1; acc. no. Q6NS57 [Pyronema omphalodes CBS 100304]